MAENVQTGSSVGAWGTAIISLLVPGAGHIWQKKIISGALAGGMVYLMFVVGLLMGGHLYDFTHQGTGGLLSYVFGLCNVGTGMLYLLCWLSDTGFLEQAHLPTFEYGNVYLMVAGLLNYVLAMDAFDLAIGRKH